VAKSSPTPPSGDEARVLSGLGELARELEAAAAQSEAEGAVADKVFALIGTLDEDARKRLFQREAVRALFEVAADKDAPAGPDDPPGTVYYRTMPGGDKSPWSKKPWTWRDLTSPTPPRQPMPLKTWVPERRVNLFWNGLAVSLVPRRPVTLPEVFYGVYQDMLRNEELAEEHAAWLMKKRDTLSDPSMVTPDGAQSRAIANHNGAVNIHVPGGGFPALNHVGSDADAPAA
jgi:hypothetical protein